MCQALEQVELTGQKLCQGNPRYVSDLREPGHDMGARERFLILVDGLESKAVSWR